MDPFEVRMQFLTFLRRLNASQQSIQKIVGFALKYFSRCGDDLWECIVEECQKGTLNMRINILYLLDNLCEASLTHQVQGPKVPQPSTSTANVAGAPGSYVQYVARDLGKIVKLVVPETRVGLVNLMSTRQILDSWRSKRILDPFLVDGLLASLRDYEGSLRLTSTSPSLEQKETSEFPKDEVLRRFEEDRERHKLLRQKRWHVPVPAQVLNPLASQPLLPKFSSALSLHPPLHAPPSPSRDSIRQDQSTAGADSSVAVSDIAQTSNATTHVESALDIEFDNAWETTSDWNEDDEDAADEENLLCFGPPQLQQQMERSIPPLAGGREREAPIAKASGARQDRERDSILPSITNGRENNYPSMPPPGPAAPPQALETSIPSSYRPRPGPSRGFYPPQGPGRGLGNGARGPGGYHPPTGEQHNPRDNHPSGYAISERPLGPRWMWGSVNQYEQQPPHQLQQTGPPPRVWPPPAPAPPTGPQSMAAYEQHSAPPYYQNGPSSQQQQHQQGGGYYGGPGGGYSMNGR